MSNHSKAAKAARAMQKETGRSYCDCLQVVRNVLLLQKDTGRSYEDCATALSRAETIEKAREILVYR